MPPAWFPNPALVDQRPCHSSHPIRHPEAAPNRVCSSACKEGDPTGSQTPLLAAANTTQMVSCRTIPVPKSCSPKSVEDETKGALRPEQPGEQSTKRRRQWVKATSPESLLPQRGQKVRRTKKKEHEGQAAAHRDVHTSHDDGDRDKELTRCRRPTGPGLQRDNALLCTSPGSATLHLIFFNDSMATGRGRCGGAVTRAGQPTKARPGRQSRAELALAALTAASRAAKTLTRT